MAPRPRRARRRTTDPTQIFNAQAPYNPAAYAAEQSLALKAPAGASNYYLNFRGAQEKYLSSGNGSNPANGGWYTSPAHGNLYTFTGTIAATLNSAPIATLAPAYYQYPALLTGVSAAGALATVTVGLSGTSLTVTDTRLCGNRADLCHRVGWPAQYHPELPGHVHRQHAGRDATGQPDGGAHAERHGGAEFDRSGRQSGDLLDPDRPASVRSSTPNSNTTCRPPSGSSKLLLQHSYDG